MLRLTNTRWSVSFDHAPLDVVADVFGVIQDCLITIHAVDSRVHVTMDFFTDDPVTPLVIADACAAMETAGADVRMRVERRTDGQDLDRDECRCVDCGTTASDDDPGDPMVKCSEGVERCGNCFAVWLNEGKAI